jgi:hypothetical protein
MGAGGDLAFEGADVGADGVCARALSLETRSQFGYAIELP